MSKARLETFTDGVIAILITIMVLELHAPHSTDIGAMRPWIPTLITYTMSFIFLGIYWNNHPHMFHAVDHVNGQILWANMHLLFWLSLVPFVTGWMGENHFARVPAALYGVVLLASGTAYVILQHYIIKSQGADSPLKRAVGSDWKGKISPVLYVLGIA